MAEPLRAVISNIAQCIQFHFYCHSRDLLRRARGRWHCGENSAAKRSGGTEAFDMPVQPARSAVRLYSPSHPRHSKWHIAIAFVVTRTVRKRRRKVESRRVTMKALHAFAQDEIPVLQRAHEHPAPSPASVAVHTQSAAADANPDEQPIRAIDALALCMAESAAGG
jgi:hypothetical protein